MKKVLSIILSIIMLLGILSGFDLFAYADINNNYDEIIDYSDFESRGTINVGFRKNIQLHFSGNAMSFSYEFIPEKDGLYELNVNIQTENITNCTHIFDDKDKENLVSQLNDVTNSSVVTHCYKNKVYYIDFSFFADDEQIMCDDEGMPIFPKANVSISLNEYSVEKIEAGEEKIVCISENVSQEMYYYSFTPDKSDLYRFTATGECAYGDYVNGYLYDINMNEIDISYDYHGDSCFFDYYCKSGISYIFASKFVRFYGGIDGSKIKMSVNQIQHNHEYQVIENIKPTCKKSGIKTYNCVICGVTKTETVAKTAHTYKPYTTKATTKKNGSVATKCTVCGAVKSKSTIYYPKTIKLSKTSYTYNGKVQMPSVTVKDSKGKTLKKNTDYTVTYAKGRKDVGKYTVTIKFKGNYSGTVKKTFTIKPKSTSISKVTAGKKKFTVKWKKLTSQTTGYQIQYSTNKNFKSAKTVTVSKNKTTSKTITKLKAKKKYYVRIRTYKTVGKTKYYSSWSKAKAVTTKK